MRYLAFVLLFVFAVGCQQNQQLPPVQPQKTVIIERHVTPPAKGGIKIEINKPQCSHDHHCGKCDVCRKNGWGGIKIEIHPKGCN